MENLNRHTRRRVLTVTAHLTANEGPLRVALNELARFGVGERIVKSAVAATIAWLIAAQIPRESAPFVAALTAVYTIDLTIVKSLRSAWQRLAGIGLGIAVAFLAAEVLGVHSWSVGLVILISLVIGLRLNLKPEGMTQVAGTAIVVMVVRSTTEERGVYSLTFLADTAIGTAIGLGVNALLAPPNYLPTAQRTLDLLVGRMTGLMDQLATMVVDGITTDEAELLSTAVGQLESDLRSVDESLANGQEALRFNVMGGQQRSRMSHFHSVNVRLEPVIARLQALVTGLGSASEEEWMSDRALTESLANLISAATVVIMDQGPVESAYRAEEHAITDVAERMRELVAFAEHRRDDFSGRSWTRLGLVVESANALADSVVRVNG